MIVKTIDSIGLRRHPGFRAENRLQSTSTEFNCFFLIFYNHRFGVSWGNISGKFGNRIHVIIHSTVLEHFVSELHF